MKRFNNLSIYRIIGAICILQFHIFFIMFDRAIPYESLLSKAVQGFIVLSGFLYSQKEISNVKEFYLKSLKKILIPATVCVLFMVIWDFIFLIANSTWDITPFIGYRAYNHSLLIQPGNYYFILYIGLCYLGVPLLKRNDKWSVIAIIVSITIELSLGFFFGNAIVGSCFFIGYYIGRKYFDHYVNPEKRYSIPLLLTWIGIVGALVGLYVVSTFNSFGNGYFVSHLQDLINNILMSSFGAASFFLIIYIFRFANKKEGFAFFKYTDSYTYVFYLMNQAFMIGAMDITYLASPMWGKILLVYLFTIVSAIGLKYIVDTINLIGKRKE